MRNKLRGIHDVQSANMLRTITATLLKYLPSCSSLAVDPHSLERPCLDHQLYIANLHSTAPGHAFSAEIVTLEEEDTAR